MPLSITLPHIRRLPAAPLAISALLGLAACGGGEQVSKFEATRVIAFGDESSVIVDSDIAGNGRKYTINGTTSATDLTRDCRVNPIWIQDVAGKYGLVFPQCNLAGVVAPRSRIRAAAGARAADVAAQVDAQVAESAIGSGDLATVLVGENDVVAAYSAYPTQTEDQIAQTLRDAGGAAARQVNRLADLGARVVVSTIIDVGVTPFGRAEKASHTDTDRAALLTRLTAAYNSGLRGTLVNDGRRIGLALLDEYVSVTAKFPGLNGILNSSDAACVPPSSLDCTAQTLVTGATTTSWLWADALRLSPAGQSSLSTLAHDRLDRNPF